VTTRKRTRMLTMIVKEKQPRAIPIQFVATQILVRLHTTNFFHASRIATSAKH
jgi:hypothetical protein